MAPGATNVTPAVELFGSRTRPAFDELGAARTLAQMIVDGILQRDRAARLVAVRRARVRLHVRHRDRRAGRTRRGALRRRDAEARGAATRDAARGRGPAALARRRLGGGAGGAGDGGSQAGELRPSAVVVVEGCGSQSEEERAHWLSIATDFGQWIDKRQLPSLTRALVAPPGDPF